MPLELIEMSTLQLLLCVLIIFFSYMVKGLSGFGSGLIAIPLLSFMFPLTLIVPVLSLLSYSGTIMQSVQLRKQVSWSDLWPLVPFTLIGVVVAAWLLVNIDANLLVTALAVFIMLYSIYSLLPVQISSAGRIWALPAGCSGGMVGTLFGTGGPFYVIYLKMRKLEKGPFRATISMIFLIDGGARVSAYAITGLYTQQVLILLLVLFPVLFLGIYAGNHLHIRIDQKRFNQLISMLLLMSSVMLLYKSIFS